MINCPYVLNTIHKLSFMKTELEPATIWLSAICATHCATSLSYPI